MEDAPATSQSSEQSTVEQSPAPADSQITTMPKTGGSKGSRKRLIVQIVVLLLLAVGGYSWWQTGFSFDISRFFKAPAEESVMTVTCGTTENVISWTFDSDADTNSVQRGNNGAKNLPNCSDYWCWLPTRAFNENFSHERPQPGGPDATFSDTQLQSDVCYEYFIMYAPQIESNHVFCPTNCNITTALGPEPTASSSAVAVSALSCSANTLSADSGEDVIFTAQNGTDVSWSVMVGTPSTGQSSSFVTKFSHSGPEETRKFDVTVSDSVSDEEATCSVSVQCAEPTCATPPSGCHYENATMCTCGVQVCDQTEDNFSCAPASQTVSVGETATLNAVGGTGAYSWSAPNGDAQSTDSAGDYRVSYDEPGGYSVAVTDGESITSCVVNVAAEVGSPAPMLDEAPTVNLLCDGSNSPCSIEVGAPYILSWTSSSATTCSASEAWSGSKNIAGSEQRAADAPGTIRYTIACTGPSGTASDSVSVDVIETTTSSIILPAAEVSTGPGQTTVLALITSAIVTLLYVGYTSTDLFRQREASDYSHGRKHPDFRG